MTKTILSVNAGSSSVKITFYTLERPPKMLANAEVSGLTAPPQTLKYERGDVKNKEKIQENLTTPQDGFKYLLQRCFTDPDLEGVASTEDLAYVCHRIVHGGDLEDAVEIDSEKYGHLVKIENLAPLYVLHSLS